jgi:hypothetical protein
MTDSNSNSGWTESDGIELKRSRENAGYDVYSYSRQNNISTFQLLELEEGGNSYFYTTSIKYNVGKKLLNSLGQKSKHQLQSETAKVQTQKDSEVLDTFLVDAIHHQPKKITNNFLTATKIYIYATALIVVLVSYAFVTHTNTSSRIEDSTQRLVTSQVSVSSPSSSAESISTRTETRTFLEESTTTKAIPTATPTKQNECNWTDNSVDVSATKATKEGNYVYLVAIKELVVCIKDQTDKVSIVNFKANESQNIYGVAPLKLQSNDLDSINIFYQGSKIRLPKEGVTQINLVAKSQH